MLLDVATVVATGIGAVGVFGIYRAYTVWRRWSNQSKINDEIELDRQIADAIKNGDAEFIAKLRKYLLMYGKRSAMEVLDRGLIKTASSSDSEPQK